MTVDNHARSCVDDRQPGAIRPSRNRCSGRYGHPSQDIGGTASVVASDRSTVFRGAGREHGRYAKAQDALERRWRSSARVRQRHQLVAIYTLNAASVHLARGEAERR